jgi:AraC family transcriptional regulator, regulatory protein of adaptative response / methylated-DNA-[protein]-cysteine methyltransferase
MAMAARKHEDSPSQYATDAQRWAAVQARDPNADDVFYYAVRTTGVFCRPSCAARPAKRTNVTFHTSIADAQRAGFRPCKRCKPDEASLRAKQAQLIAAACKMIETKEEAPDLEALAEAAGLSRFHFHRLFKRVTGLTPKAYANAHRTQRVQRELAKGASVTDAIYSAGYNSNSPFYASSSKNLGMRPSEYRSSGRGTAIRFAVAQCSLGSLLVAASDKGVCAILLGEDPDALVRDLQDRFRNAELIGGDREFEGWVAKILGFIEAPRIGLDLPLDLRGTAFQQRVWQTLRTIPAGETISYTELAKRVGLPTATRAVASACGANHIAVAIPCHRVVRTDGSLSGYRWGVERKKELLMRERASKKGDPVIK